MWCWWKSKESNETQGETQVLTQQTSNLMRWRYRAWQDVAGKQTCSTDSSSKAADSSSKAAEITFRIQTCSTEEQTWAQAHTTHVTRLSVSAEAVLNQSLTDTHSLYASSTCDERRMWWAVRCILHVIHKKHLHDCMRASVRLLTSRPEFWGPLSCIGEYMALQVSRASSHS